MRKFYWKHICSHLEMEEIRSSIIGSIRMVYSAFYFGYEDYLASVAREILGLPPVAKIFGKQLAIKLNNAFGEDVAGQFVNAKDLKLACLIRNSIAHCGGRVTEELESFDTRFKDATNVSLSPDDCRKLHELVAGKSLELAKKYRMLTG